MHLATKSALAPLLAIFTVATAAPTACGPRAQESRTADIVTDVYDPAAPYLYYRDGSAIARTPCPPGRVFYDRTVCDARPEWVERVDFIRNLSAFFGAKIPAIEAGIDAHYVKVARLDAKLLAMLSDVPTPPNTDQLRAAMTAKEGEIGTLSTQLAAVAGEKARVQKLLEQAEDSDLRLMLARLRETEGRLLVQRDERQTELQAIRERFITANGDRLDTAIFASLRDQRTNAVNEVMRLRESMDEQIAGIAAFNKAIAAIEDATFVFEVMEDDPDHPFSEVAGHMNAAFKKAWFREITRETEARFTLADYDTNDQLELDPTVVTINGPVGNFDVLTYRLSIANDPDLNLSCGGATVTITSAGIHEAVTLTFEDLDSPVGGYSARGKLEAKHIPENVRLLSTRPIASTWSIELFCFVMDTDESSNIYQLSTEATWTFSPIQ